MTRLRTTLVAAGLGTALIATGAVVASSALATPAPVAAVAALDPASVDADTVADPVPDTATPRAAARGWWNKLTDDQRSCLQDAKITRPVGPLDDAERAALRAKVEAAATTCKVTLPFAKTRAFWDGLTDEQQTCLKDAAVNRPWGPMTKDQRKQVRADLKAAAEKCGVTMPTKAPAL
ncbi:MAG TPA: hypothetical protein VES93_07190 [Ornithinibacter sp.]|nr:hypothetical protein [Ornithinibacter sp.]